MNIFQYMLAVGCGIGVAFCIFGSVSQLHIIFIQLTLAGLIPSWIAGLSGGFVTGLIAPRHKLIVATSVGFFLMFLLMSFFLRYGWSHNDYRHPLIWYWPIYLLPTFALGGYLARRP